MFLSGGELFLCRGSLFPVSAFLSSPSFLPGWPHRSGQSKGHWDICVSTVIAHHFSITNRLLVRQRRPTSSWSRTGAANTRGPPLFFFHLSLKEQCSSWLQAETGGAPLMFLQSSEALCCLNKVHLWDNKTLEDTWIWFEPNGFMMLHIPKSSSLPRLSVFTFIFFPAPLSRQSHPFSLYLSTTIIYYSSSEHASYSGNLNSAHLGGRRAAGPFISHDSFQSLEEEDTGSRRRTETRKPQTLAKGFSFNVPGALDFNWMKGICSMCSEFLKRFLPPRINQRLEMGLPSFQSFG